MSPNWLLVRGFHKETNGTIIMKKGKVNRFRSYQLSKRVIINVINSVSCGITEKLWYSRHYPFIFNSNLADVRSFPTSILVIFFLLQMGMFPRWYISQSVLSQCLGSESVCFVFWSKTLVVENRATWCTFYRPKVKLFPHFHVPFFYVFLTPKSYELSLLKSFQVPLFYTKDIIKIFI